MCCSISVVILCVMLVGGSGLSVVVFMFILVVVVE